MANHVKAFETLKARQTLERQIERDGHYQKTRAVTFQVAKTSLAQEHTRAVAVEIAVQAPTFRRAPAPAPEQTLATKPRPPAPTVAYFYSAALAWDDSAVDIHGMKPMKARKRIARSRTFCWRGSRGHKPSLPVTIFPPSAQNKNK